MPYHTYLFELKKYFSDILFLLYLNEEEKKICRYLSIFSSLLFFRRSSSVLIFSSYILSLFFALMRVYDELTNLEW